MSAPQHAIDYIEFATQDLAAARDFLSAVFGWKFTDYGPQYTSFEDGRIYGGLRSDLKTVPAAGNPTVVMYSSSLEKSLVRVKAAGGRVTAEPYEFPGGRRFEFAAPGGLALSVWSDVRTDGTKID